MIRNSDKIIIHCKKASIDFLHQYYPEIDDRKICFVPMPIERFSYAEKYLKYEKKEGDIVLSFIGAVKQYKNVEMIIKAANHFSGHDRLKFLICGHCSSEEYKNSLLRMIESGNIICDFRFIPNDEIYSLIDMSDAVIFPYETKSALNSGAVFIPFSLGKTVISTDIGTLDDFDSNLFYKYGYSDDENIHLCNLVRAIQLFLNDYLQQPEKIIKNGKILESKVGKDNSIPEVTDSIEKVYRSLM